MDNRRSSVRERTQRHLTRLLASAAAAGIMQGCNCGGSGYGVVDPMPAPAKCPGLGKLLKPTVKVVDDQGKKMIEVDIAPPEGRDDVTLIGEVYDMGTVLPSKVVAGHLIFRFAAQPETKVLSFSIACDAGQMQVATTIASGDGGPPTIETHDLY